MHREAEPGVDLSHLPGPEGPAAALVDTIERESVGFGRFEAQKLVAISFFVLSAVFLRRVDPRPRDQRLAASASPS